MKFEIGKCYVHTTGEKIRIIARVNTYFYGEALLAETNEGNYYPVGENEDNTINWSECEDFAKEDVTRNLSAVSDHFICEKCRVYLENWMKTVYEEDTEDTYCNEYEFKFCPECGRRVVEE